MLLVFVHEGTTETEKLQKGWNVKILISEKHIQWRKSWEGGERWSGYTLLKCKEHLGIVLVSWKNGKTQKDCSAVPLMEMVCLFVMLSVILLFASTSKETLSISFCYWFQ